MIKSSLILLLFIITNNLFAQDHFPNTLFFSDSIPSPEASLEEVAWIAGHWQGEAFGGIVEEIWTPPLGNSMMCAFKLVVDKQVRFYEIVTLSEDNGTLILRLKHFNDNLTGWEEKDETVDFRLVKVMDNKVFFDGFTFERIDENEMNIYVVIESNGRKHETKFNYHRVN